MGNKASFPSSKHNVLPNAVNAVILLGPYGSGKSQFVDSLTQTTNWANHTLNSDDQLIRQTSIVIRDKTIVLVDTPGFDDQPRSANDVLRDVEVWMRDNEILKTDVNLTSILYLHRITDKRLIIKPPISAFKRLCGDDFAKRGADSAERGDDSAMHGKVIFVTTHWDCVSIQYGQAQEQNFRHYLPSVLGFPVRMERFDKTTQAARDIIGQII